MTGGDLVRVEEKYKSPVYAKLFTKFIFASNDELSLTGRKADMRRALYVAIDSFEGETDTLYVDKLCAEAPAIYALCLEKYRQLCPNHGPINQSAKNKESTKFDFENSIDAFFSSYFVFSPKAQITGKEWLDAKVHHLGGRKPGKEEEEIFRQALLTKNLERKRTGSGWIVKGIRKKSSVEIYHANATAVNNAVSWPHN